MPTITIYLTNDLYDKVRDAPSKTVKAALEHYFKDDEDEPAKNPEQHQQPSNEPHKNSNATGTGTE